MAGLVVVDTDIVIDFLRGREPGTRLIRDLLRERLLRLTCVSGFELQVGTDFLDRQAQIMRLFRSRTVPLDLTAALQAGAIAATLQRSGSPIGLADCLQAGICMRHGLPLATRNRKHFARIDGLRLVDIGSA